MAYALGQQPFSHKVDVIALGNAGMIERGALAAPDAPGGRIEIDRALHNGTIFGDLIDRSGAAEARGFRRVEAERRMFLIEAVGPS